jgi:hypothetical protein
VCYPGCGNFTSIYTQNQFQNLILTYVPCSPSQCTVDIVGQSSQCNSCSNNTAQGNRLLHDNGYLQSSTISFTIKSTGSLDDQVVSTNLNSNITNMNNDLTAFSFRINSNFIRITPAVSNQVAQSDPQYDLQRMSHHLFSIS